uniref:Protein LYRIC-like n=1 Tax=Sinocyclocheilus anshuiensis TaxID=1608454 RepID=A0A671Q5B5_9TELE
MAPGWQEIASQHVEQITGYVRETLSTGLVYLKSELGIDLGLNPDLCAPWLLLLSAWGGLVLILILWVSVCRGLSKRLSGTETGADNTGPAQTVKKADEPRRRNRKKNAKKNKKKAKPPAKEKKSSTSVDGKEPDEGTWETKVSNREKRQQRRKDKTPGDESGSPVATAASSAISTMEEVQTTPEEPETTITTTVSTPPVQREVEGMFTTSEPSLSVFAVPDLSWSAQPSVPVDDEWSGINSTSADLLCDWNAPSEEWGNYVEQQPVSAAPIEPPVPEVAQESDNEKDKDEAGAPGSGRAKKKKKKKKVEDAVPSAQVRILPEINSK